MMKNFKNYVIYALMALVALFTKACECDSFLDPPVKDKYCVNLGTQAVVLQPGESREISISDGGCDPINPVLPWKASDLDAPYGFNSSDPLVLSVELKNASSATGASVRLTNLAGDVLSVMPNLPVRRHHTVYIDLAGSGNPKHKKVVYGSYIQVELVTPGAAAQNTDQKFSALISAAPTVRKFATTQLKPSAPQTVVVTNRSSSGGAVQITASSTDRAFVVSPSSFTLSPKRIQKVQITFVPQVPGTVFGQVIFSGAGTNVAAVVVTGVSTN